MVVVFVVVLLSWFNSRLIIREGAICGEGRSLREEEQVVGESHGQHDQLSIAPHHVDTFLLLIRDASVGSPRRCTLLLPL